MKGIKKSVKEVIKWIVRGAIYIWLKIYYRADIRGLENIKDRDKRDSTRKVSPLKKADDAIYIDSSDMTIEEVVDKVITLIKEKYKK